MKNYRYIKLFDADASVENILIVNCLIVSWSLFKDFQLFFIPIQIYCSLVRLLDLFSVFFSKRIKIKKSIRKNDLSKKRSDELVTYQKISTQ